MRSLFLGLGKVNLSLAKVISGEKLGFVEEAGEVVVSEFVPTAEKFTEKERVSGDFDSFRWESYLPARVFVSPGIDPRRKFFPVVRNSEVRELTFFCSRFPGKIIAVTGTDGKSTFTLQLGEVMKRAFPSLKIFVGGNLGNAMGQGLLEPYDLAVIEISSFQAERLSSARLDVAIILNLDIDHLDRYDSLESYHLAKWNLVKFSRESAYPNDVIPPTGVSASFVSFSNRESLDLILEKVVKHLSQSFGFEFREELLQRLPRLRHRMERLEDRDGRVFVNDSKATTVHATLYALSQIQNEFSSGVKLILGGKYKGDDFTRLLQNLRKQDEVWICGAAREVIRKQLSESRARVSIFSSLRELLKDRLSHIRSGDCVLLSPACSSYDEFHHFEERGDFFVNQVKEKFRITDAVR